MSDDELNEQLEALEFIETQFEPIVEEPVVAEPVVGNKKVKNNKRDRSPKEKISNHCL